MASVFTQKTGRVTYSAPVAQSPLAAENTIKRESIEAILPVLQFINSSTVTLFPQSCDDALNSGIDALNADPDDSRCSKALSTKGDGFLLAIAQNVRLTLGEAIVLSYRS